MVRPTRTPLQRIQDKGTGQDIARRFFYTFVTPSMITKQKYGAAWNMRDKTRKSFVMPIIQKYLSEWKAANFIDTSRIEIPITIERKNTKPYNLKSYGYLLNLEPLFSFCKIKEIEFSQEEKIFLKLLLLPDFTRNSILRWFPEVEKENDIITATLKYYARFCILRYSNMARDILENPGKYKKIIEHNKNIPKELINASSRLLKNIEKKYGMKSERIKSETFEVIKALAYKPHEDMFNAEDLLFRGYVSGISSKKTLVASCDRKIMQALGLGS